MGRCQILYRTLYPFVPLLVIVRRQGESEGRIRSGPNLVQAEIRSDRVHNATLRKRGILHVPVPMACVLLAIGTVRFHRPDVHDAVLIAEEVNPVLPPHWIAACTRI